MPPAQDALLKCVAKMRAAGVSDACISAFSAQHASVSSGESGDIPEATITPVATLPALADLPPVEPKDAPVLLAKTIMMKLNGGLGTGMGLDKAKSLLVVKDGLTFLDFAARHVLHNKARAAGAGIRFMLMNSFSTSDDTKAYIDPRYGPTQKPADRLYEGSFSADVELMQNKVPKVNRETFLPATYAADPSIEWCPPGHGDLYAALLGTGKLDKLIEDGYEYLFVSNSDNLGACLDMSLLNHFSSAGLDFLVEVCERTEADKKGGHLARRNADGRLILRESAQCPKADEASFQNVGMHRFFNTNNLWVNLRSLKATMATNGGLLPLPVIRNAKTINPTDAKSEAVFQMETAMGAAISCFDKTAAIVVPRERFAPVKTCNELLGLRTDSYVTTDDYRLVLAPSRNGTPPVISLEDKYYKFVSNFDKIVAGNDSLPSTVQCTHLKVAGPIVFRKAGVVLIGDVTITNADGEGRAEVTPGEYTGKVSVSPRDE